MIKDYLIIFFPLADWEAPWQRYQHLALLFSRTNKVVYINFGVAITYMMRNPLGLMKKWLRFLLGRTKINSNLTIYYPPPCIPFERSSRWINLLNQYILFLYIRIFMKPKRSLILWMNDPYKYLMIKLLKPKIAVYDCPDAIVFKDKSKKQRVYDQLRKEVLEKSTVSIFTSKVLLEEGRKYSKKCFSVPNGVDIHSFTGIQHRIPEEIRNCSGIILGLVGTFDERIDIDLIHHILGNIREVNLVIVGPVHTTIGR